VGNQVGNASSNVAVAALVEPGGIKELVEPGGIKESYKI
jgi:hypothetical protein